MSHCVRHDKLDFELSTFYFCHSDILFFVIPTKKESHNKFPFALHVMSLCVRHFSPLFYQSDFLVFSLRHSVFVLPTKEESHNKVPAPLHVTSLCVRQDKLDFVLPTFYFCHSDILFLSFRRRRNHIISFRLCS